MEKNGHMIMFKINIQPHIKKNDQKTGTWIHPHVRLEDVNWDDRCFSFSTAYRVVPPL